KEVKRLIGYVPGEIAFPDIGSGAAFIRNQAEMLGVGDLSYAKELARILRIDLRADLKHMSKGMKQKTALVGALMGDARILVMDEPSTGLDPLMRQSFIEVIQGQRARGKTVVMSSHLYGEVERLCDRAALMHAGRVADMVGVGEIGGHPYTEYKIGFEGEEGYGRFMRLGYEIVRDQPEQLQVTARIRKDAVGGLLENLKPMRLRFLSENGYTLERRFRQTLADMGRGGAG
ncbi:MAG: AAA family ATPase, partial [Oscillospiraceae bacterium]|nr:AAA family ATPase [Oscillospiraceae bacterium]